MNELCEEIANSFSEIIDSDFVSDDLNVFIKNIIRMKLKKY